MIRLLALAALLALPAHAATQRQGALTLDGMPAEAQDAALAARLAPYQNTRGAALMAWAPDGSGVLIGTRFGDTQQVHFVGKPGADRQQLTFFDDAVPFAYFDPTRGTRGFYFTRDVGGDEFFQWYWMDRASGTATLLTDGKARNESYTVWEKGGKAAWASTVRNGRDFDIWYRDGDGPGRLLLERQGQWNPAGWSKDGKQLLLVNQISVNDSNVSVLDLASMKETHLWPPAGKKAAIDSPFLSRDGKWLYVSTDLDSDWKQLVRVDLATMKSEVLTPDVHWDVRFMTQSFDGKWFTYVVNEGGQSALYLGSPRAFGKMKRLALPEGLIFGMAFDWQNKRLAINLSTPQAPQDVYVHDLRTLKLERWTVSETGGLDPTRFVKPQRITIKSFDGVEFTALRYGKAQPGKQPVIIDIHGGPEGQALVQFNPLVQMWVNELGVTVIQPNYRGSTGYGKKFVQLDDGFGRVGAVKDLGALLDWVAAQPELDARRVAVMGSSYGGFMTLASLVAYAGRLACGVDMVGISHFVTFLEHTEAYRRDLRRAEYGDERDPKMRKFLSDISPLTSASKIKAPLFVIQGKNDPRVPMSEAEQVVRLVRQAGGQVWYLLADDEGHGFKKKGNRDVMVTAIAAFYRRYLLGTPSI